MTIPTSELSGVAMILGGALAMVYAPLLLMPERARGWIAKFPRSKWVGWVLAAVDLIWSGWLLDATPMPWLDPYKRWLIVAVPVAFVLVVVLLDELLAPRALGGLLLLVPASILDAAFMHPSPFSYVVKVLAYVFAVWGMVLVLSPYQFRKAAAVCFRSDTSCRVWGGAGLFLGAFIIGLGIWAY